MSYFVIECMGFHVFAVLIINIFQSFKDYTFDIQLQFPLAEARLHSKGKLSPNGGFRL